MTYEPRPFLPAVVGPRAALIITREVGAQLEMLATAFEASPIEGNRSAGAEIRAAVRSLREAGRQWREREKASADGNSEVAGGVGGPSSESPPLTLLSVGQVATRIQRSTRQVRNLCKPGGALVATKRGCVWLVDEASVTEYQATRRPVE